MSRCVSSSSARAGSTDAHRVLPVGLGEVARIEPQHARSREAAAPDICARYIQLGKLRCSSEKSIT